MVGFIGPDTPMSSDARTCLEARTPFPVLGFITSTFCAFVVGVIVGFALSLRYPAHPRSKKDVTAAPNAQ